MNNEERARILARHGQRRASQPSEPAPPPPPEQPERQAVVRGSGGLQVKIIDPNNRPQRVRPRGNVVVQQQQTSSPKRRVYGATVVDPGDRPGNVRVQPQPTQKMYGGRVVSKTETESSTGVRAVLSTPVPAARVPGAPGPMPGPGGIPPELAQAMNNLTPTSSVGLPGAQIYGQAPAAAPAPASAVAPVDVTVVMSQWLRPELLDRQLRALDSQSAAATARLLIVNPAPYRLDPKDVQHVQRVTHIRASEDLGPWTRWLWASGAQTKYVLVLDDDCLPAPGWLKLAVDRMEKSPDDEPCCVAAGGMIFNSDTYNDTFPVSPESMQRDETIVDVGIGAWLLRTSWLRHILDFPRIGSPLATKLHVAAALQHEEIPTVVLPYPHNQRDGWGMLEPLRPSTIAAQIDGVSQQTGVTAEQLRYQDYLSYRQDAGWEPLIVMQEAVQSEPDAVPDQDKVAAEA